MYVVVVQKFKFAISSPDEFLYPICIEVGKQKNRVNSLGQDSTLKIVNVQMQRLTMSLTLCLVVAYAVRPHLFKNRFSVKLIEIKMAYKICKKNRKKKGYEETEIVSSHVRQLCFWFYIELDV